ncbi:MAG: hypothetical protein U0136_14595 [Bdellovibrionota bacterium]
MNRVRVVVDAPGPLRILLDLAFLSFRVFGFVPLSAEGVSPLKQEAIRKKVVGKTHGKFAISGYEDTELD